MNTTILPLSVATLNEKLHENYNRNPHKELSITQLANWGSVRYKRIVNYMKWLGLDLHQDMACLCGNYDGLVNRVVSLNAISGYNHLQIKAAVEKLFEVLYLKIPTRSFRALLTDDLTLIKKGPSNCASIMRITKKNTTGPSTILTPAVVNHVLNAHRIQDYIPMHNNIRNGTINFNQRHLENQNGSNIYPAFFGAMPNQMLPNNLALGVQANQVQLNHQPMLATISNEMLTVYSPVAMQANRAQENPQQATESREPHRAYKYTNLKYNELILKIIAILRSSKNGYENSSSPNICNKIRELFIHEFISNQVMIEYLAANKIILLEKNSRISLHTVVGWEHKADEFLVIKKQQPDITEVLAAILDYATDFKKNKNFKCEYSVLVRSTIAKEFTATCLARINGYKLSLITNILAQYGVIDKSGVVSDCSKVLNLLYQAILVRMDANTKEGQSDRGAKDAIWQVICSFFKSNLTVEDKIKTFSTWHAEANNQSRNTHPIISAPGTLFSPPPVLQRIETRPPQLIIPDKNAGVIPTINISPTLESVIDDDPYSEFFSAVISPVRLDNSLFPTDGDNEQIDLTSPTDLDMGASDWIFPTDSSESDNLDNDCNWRKFWL